MTRLNFTVIFIIAIINLSSTPGISAHFFPNVSSIPRSLIPNGTAWDKFNSFSGCRYGENLTGLSQLKQYFQRFGYINDSFKNFTDQFDDSLEEAVKVYQKNFNLNATGELDSTTLAHIVRPRCGNADIVNGTTTMNSGKPTSTNSEHIHTVEHYSFFQGRPTWRKTALSYAFSPNRQQDWQADVRAVFASAFDRWSEVTPLTFTETTSLERADIQIGMYSGAHNDAEPFDGVLGTLAHAFSPPSGILHLDGAENWVVHGSEINIPSFTSGVDLESVAVHEIGHLLGLGHSSDESAIMYPTIDSSSRKVELTVDDVAGIQDLYGSNPDFNGTLPRLTPSGERDTSGAPELTRSWILLFIGLLLAYFSC